MPCLCVVPPEMGFQTSSPSSTTCQSCSSGCPLLYGLPQQAGAGRNWSMSTCPTTSLVSTYLRLLICVAKLLSCKAILIYMSPQMMHESAYCSPVTEKETGTQSKVTCPVSHRSTEAMRSPAQILRSSPDTPTCSAPSPVLREAHSLARRAHHSLRSRPCSVLTSWVKKTLVYRRTC